MWAKSPLLLYYVIAISEASCFVRIMMLCHCALQFYNACTVYNYYKKVMQKVLAVDMHCTIELLCIDLVILL